VSYQQPMPCHISDGPAEPEDVDSYTEIRVDVTFDEARQLQIDEEFFANQPPVGHN